MFIFIFLFVSGLLWLYCLASIPQPIKIKEFAEYKPPKISPIQTLINYEDDLPRKIDEMCVLNLQYVDKLRKYLEESGYNNSQISSLRSIKKL